MSSKYNDNDELFDNVCTLSDRITKLHDRLSEAEIKYGRESEEYRKIVTAIDLSREYENRLITEIFNDSSVIAEFNKYMEDNSCRVLQERISTDLDLSKDLFYAMANERYDEKMENQEMVPPRHVFLEAEFDKHGKRVIGNNLFNLLHIKKMLLIIDEYIARTDDKKMKAFLITKKNTLLNENKLAESWYFGLSDNLDALTVDIDSFSADYLGLGQREYFHLKNSFFDALAHDTVELIMRENPLLPEVKITYELYFLAALLNMDIGYYNFNYKNFTRDYGYSLNREKVNMVDDMYGKASVMAKRLIQKYYNCEV